MPKPLAERTRRRLIKNFSNRFEQLVQEKHDWNQQIGAGNAARVVADNYFALGETDDAREWYKKATNVYIGALELDPTWEKDPAFTIRERYRIGQALWRSGKEREAYEHFRTVIEILHHRLETTRESEHSISTGQALSNLGYCHLFLGDFESAYVFAKRKYGIDQERELMIRKLKNPGLKNPPRLPPSRSVLYNMCKALVEKDKEALARAKKGLEQNIARELFSDSGRGVYTDLRIVLERAEEETFQS